MNYDTIKILGDTLEHLRRRPLGHLKVAVLEFVMIQFLVLFLMLLAFGGVAGVSATSDGDPQPLVVLAASVGFATLFGAFIMPLALFGWGYHAATLDELDGKGDVSVGRVLSRVGGVALAGLSLMVVQCGLGVVGLCFCYIGAFVTTLPLRYAFLLRVDRGLTVTEAVMTAWNGFWAHPGPHFKAMLATLVLTMVLSYIPLIGTMLLLPVLAVFEVRSYRVIHGPGGL